MTTLPLYASGLALVVEHRHGGMPASTLERGQISRHGMKIRHGLGMSAEVLEPDAGIPPGRLERLLDYGFKLGDVLMTHAPTRHVVEICAGRSRHEPDDGATGAGSSALCRCSAAAMPASVVIDEDDQPLDARDDGELAQGALETAAQAGRNGPLLVGIRVAAASTVSTPSPTTSCAPAGHSFTAPSVSERPALDLAGVAVSARCDEFRSARQSRHCASARRAGMSVPSNGQRGWKRSTASTSAGSAARSMLAGVGEIARGERAGDGDRLSPQP